MNSPAAAVAVADRSPRRRSHSFPRTYSSTLEIDDGIGGHDRLLVDGASARGAGHHNQRRGLFDAATVLTGWARGLSSGGGGRKSWPPPSRDLVRQRRRWSPASAVAAIAAVGLAAYAVSTARRRRTPVRRPTWEWDRFHYDNRVVHRDDEKANDEKPNSATISANKIERNLLMAQAAAYGTYNDEFMEISSRPNRAYAKYWGHDFVRIVGTPPWKFQFDLLYSLVPGKQKQEGAASYDTVLFLDANSIVMNFEYDLRSLIDEKAFLTVGNGVLLWNLNHPRAAMLIEECIEQSKMLRERTIEGQAVMVNVVKGSSYGKSDVLIRPIKASSLADGDVIKSVGTLDDPSGQKSRLSMDSFYSKMATLQGIADMVCYRFYPRCELF